MATSIARETAKRNLAKAEARWKALFEKQESMKPKKATVLMKDGGKVQKMVGGGKAVNRARNNLTSGFNLSNLIGVNNSLRGTNLAKTTPNAQAGWMSGLGDKMSGMGSGVGQWIGDNAGDIGYGLLTAAPALYNLYEGLQPAEQTDPTDFYNPKAGEAIADMASRRYDPSQALRETELGYATGAYGLEQAAGGDRSLLFGNKSALMGTSQRNKANILSKAQNINAQYTGDLAAMKYGYGQDMSQINMPVADWNARDRASRRSYLGQAASDFSMGAQTNRLMENQEFRDEQRLSLFPDMYGDIYPYMKNLQNIRTSKG